MWTIWTNYTVGNDYKSFKDISKYCDNFSWSDDTDTISTTLAFDSILDLAEGRSHIVFKKDDKVVFQGLIIKKTQKNTSGSYTAQDYGFYLKNEDIFQFNNIDAKSAIYQILKKHNIGGACIPLATKIKQFYYDKSLSDIIKDILTQCQLDIGEDVCMEMRGTTLWIDKISNLKLDCKYIIGNDYSVTRDMSNMINYVIVRSSSNQYVSGIQATVSDANNIKIFGELSKILSLENYTNAQARNAAKNYLNAFDATNKEFTVTLLDVEGCEDIRANRKIYIDLGNYGVKGYYKVKSANHTVNNGIHKIQITVDFSGATFSDPTQTSTTATANAETKADDTKANKIITYAKKFLGVKYVSGGKTPNGFDCSGFVAYVFKNFGINLTPYTYTMINEGKRVNISNIQPCDLVFFFNTGHVGIYVGNDKFIQAPHTGDVVKISTFSGYYKQNCNAVVRVL
ncbi:C40 family peptidase [Clostridium tyrobutyricum]|uniref:C40 family peptidase n=1 Tax=Clostridium tyrobutyricum TaxID=1519 RepID=UPI0034A0CE9F